MRIVASPPDGPPDTVDAERSGEAGSPCLLFLLAAHFLSMTFIRRRLNFPGVNVEDVQNQSKTTFLSVNCLQLHFGRFARGSAALSDFFFLVGTNCTFFSNPETLCGCAKTNSAACVG